MIAVQNANLPFSKDEVLHELKEILFVQATQISVALNSEVASQFLGIDIDSWDDRLHDDDREKIDLKRFNIFRLVDRAFDFAFQTGEHWKFDGDDWYEICGFSAGVTPHSLEGSQSPWLWDHGKVRHVVDMSIGRYHLENDLTISIRGLSLLASMTEAAVRNSLSKEGIQTSGKPASVENETALKWLMERRGFVPTKKTESDAKSRERSQTFNLDYYEFPEAFSRLVQLQGSDPEVLSSASGVSRDKLLMAMSGELLLMDVKQLAALGRALNLVDMPRFVSKAIEFGLRKGIDASS